jgi:hypothetical protein
MKIEYTFIMKEVMEDSDGRYYGNINTFELPREGRTVTNTVTGEQTWPQLVETFEEWLRGVGYVFDGHLVLEDYEGQGSAIQEDSLRAAVERTTSTFDHINLQEAMDGIKITGDADKLTYESNHLDLSRKLDKSNVLNRFA